MDSFLQPIYVPSIGYGIRIFTDEVNRSAPDNPMWAHPDDFDLYHLASFDDQDGKFTNLDAPSQVCIGKQVAVRT